MLNTVNISSGAPQPAGAAAQKLSPFSALTASSQLESLTLAHTKDAKEGDQPIQPLPQGAVSGMFPPGRQLNALTGDIVKERKGDGLPVASAAIVLSFPHHWVQYYFNFAVAVQSGSVAVHVGRRPLACLHTGQVLSCVQHTQTEPEHAWIARWH